MPDLFAKGQDGQLELNGEMLSIRRKGVFAKVNKGLTAGERRIPLANITAVQFKPAGLAQGYIRFSVLGSIDTRPGLLKGQSDENQVQFLRTHRAEFEEIRDRVEASISRRVDAQIAPTPSSQVLDPMDQVRKLAELRNQGIVSEEEFQAKKRSLLGL